MSVSFDGVGQVCATFLGAGIQEGQAVKVSGRGAAAPCGDGESFCGAAVCCRDDACTVQVGGFVTVGYSGDMPEPGTASLCANGEGGVRAAGESAGRACLVVDADAAAKTVTILL